MNPFNGKSIRSRLALALWGAALLTFVLAGIGLLVHQNLTLQDRAAQIMEPYARLISVGADTAIAFEDPVRAQEILDTLRANPQIREAAITLDDGRILAEFNLGESNTTPPRLPRPDGVYVGRNTVELLQFLPKGGRIYVRMGLEQLTAQTHQALWAFAGAMLALLAVTLVQLAVLRRTIVHPIDALTGAAEFIRARGDYRHRIPVSDTDELARLGQGFNAMLDAIGERENQLRRLSDFQRTILENVAYGIISANPDGVVTSFNPAAQRLLGYSAHEVVGKLSPMCWHDLDEIGQRAVQLSKELGEPIRAGFDVFAARPSRNLPEEHEWTFIRKDGRKVPVSLSITALRDENGHIAGFVGLTYDLTERKQSQHQLQLLSFALDTVKEAILLMGDSDPRFLYVNRNAASALGYSQQELIGGMSLFDIAPDATPDAWKQFWPELCARHTMQYESSLRTRDGRTYPVEIAASHFEFDGKAYSLAICRDITQRKEDEQVLHRLNRELLAISDCNQMLVRAENEQSLLDDICRIVCDNAGYRMAWVGYIDEAAPPDIRVVARAGSDPGCLDTAFQIASAGEHPETPTEIAARTGEIAGFDDFTADPDAAPWRDVALQCGYRSSISLPLKDKRRTFGVMNIYSTEAHAFNPEEKRLLSELADDLAFGIVTLREKAEHARAEEQMKIAATAFEAQEGIMITDANAVILRVNRAFTEITGYTAEDVVGKKPNLLSSGHHDESFYRAMWNRISTDGFWQGEIWNRRKTGDLFPEWLTITAVRNAEGQITHYVSTMTDITQRKEAEKKIEHLAFYDLLTGLPNRRLFVDRLHQAMAGSSRSQRMGAILFIDLDNFKFINDTCGHDIGDRLLVEVAHRLTACVRDGDTISRLGGDEFVAMLEDLSDNPREAAAQAKSVASKVLSVLNQPYTIAGRVHHSTPSIGAALFVGTGDSVDELLKQADIAMYQAKAAGRNTLRFFDPEMQATVAARAALEGDLRKAIDAMHFSLHYQPQVDSGGRIFGAEALLRWQHPEQGMISPAQFIPLAEETGLILPIGQWVLEQACSVLADWSRNPNLAGLQLAINVSARQFRQPNFVGRVRQALLSSRAPAARLKLELTESLVLDNVEDTIEKMNALKTLGVGFSMDDFGTGYSSLSYLTRLPLDQLKIDQSFVRHLPDNATDAVVAQAIIMLAHSLGLAVIAEGVETEAQRGFLAEHGCPAFQGYLFGRPVPQAEFESLALKEPTEPTNATS